MRANTIRLLLVVAISCAFGIPDAAAAQVTGKNRADQAKPKAGEPCCNIVAIDLANLTVTARETASGYKFKVSDKKLLATLKVGEKVWADFTKKSVRLRKAEGEPCCNIIVAQPGLPGGIR